jgi:hypothetical protein
MEINLNILPDKLDLPSFPQNDSHPSYFTLPTTIAAVGPRGSGKTYSISMWLNYMFSRMYFTRFFVISATYDSNPTLHLMPTRTGDIYTDLETASEALGSISSDVENDANWYTEMTGAYAKAYSKWEKKKKNPKKMKKDVLDYLYSKQKPIAMYYKQLMDRHKANIESSRPINKTDELILSRSHVPSEPDFIRIMSGVQYFFEESEEADKIWFFPTPFLLRPQPVLFIDDASHSPLYSTSRSNPLVNLVLRHRHIGGLGFGLSIIFAVQTFKTGVPKALRSNTMQFLLFKTQDVSVLEEIWKEIGGIVSWEEFQRIYHRAVQEKHDFLLVDSNVKDERHAFRRGWDVILVREQTLLNYHADHYEEGESPPQHVNKKQKTN